VGTQTRSGFPTLAEQLVNGAPRTKETSGRSFVAFFEDLSRKSTWRALPKGSVVLTDLEEGVDELLDVVRANDGDVLLVSDAGLLERHVLCGLQAALAYDSACSTVSVDADSRPVSPGLPPPGIDFPQAGVVLVRREDLLLATDEADLTGKFVSGSMQELGGGPIVASLLTLLDRPGFVHRAYGLEGEYPSAYRRKDQRRAQPSLSDVRVVIDGTCLAHPLTGTQVQVLALVVALARAGADIAVMRPQALHPSVVAQVQALTGDVAFVERRAVGRPDVFHRPFQLVSLHDLADRLVIGERLVLTHQDMIWSRTRAYHDGGGWRDYRIATRTALASADEVAFFSLHAAIDAASDGSLELERATVVPLGVDHLVGRDDQSLATRPLGGRPYLLMVGSSFWHKGRVFSLRVLRWLVEEGGWDGGLVLVGGHHTRTSSVPAEELFLRQTPSLDQRVVDLGHVPELEQRALYRHAELVLFPSLYEGFGLIPFEAAALGTASVYAHRAAMAELLPASGALPSFEIERAGGFVLRVLESKAERQRIVEEISAVAADLTWDRTAAGYLTVYERALARPRRDVSSLLQATLETKGALGLTPREAALIDVYRRRRAVRVTVDSALRAATVALGGVRRLRGRGRGGYR
jgi:glycosyltransferase involved in cell wall biosynthesis